MESLSIICVETGFLFWPMFLIWFPNINFAFQTVHSSIQPDVTTIEKATHTRSSGEVWDEQTSGVTHMWRMTFDSVLTLFANGRTQLWEVLTTYSRVGGRTWSNFPSETLGRVRILKWQISKPYLRSAASKTLGMWRFFNLKSILRQLGHYLTIRTSKQYNQFQQYNEESYNIKKKKLVRSMRNLAFRDSKDSTIFWKLAFVIINVHDKKPVI